MRRLPLARALPASALAVLVVSLAACGGGGGGKSSSNPTGKPTAGKQGGNLTVLYAGDVDYLDPGAAYYQYSFNVMYSIMRPLYSYKPTDPLHPFPDLAAGPAKISPDGKTVTVKIKSGVKFSPPVNREVTSKDVKYAMERAFYPSVAGGYASAYFGDLVGLPKTLKPASAPRYVAV